MSITAPTLDGFPLLQCRRLSLAGADVAVLNTQHHVGAGAAAGALLEQVATMQ